MRSQQFNGAAAILVLSFVAQATAWYIFKGHCPKNMTSIGKLDVQRFLGKWYHYAMYPYTTGKSTKCMSNDYQREGNTTNYTLIKKHINAFTDTVTVKKYKINYFDAAVGKIEIETHHANPKSLEFYILDTDYDNFSNLFMCIDSNVLNIQWGWIFTRQRIPTSETVFAAQKLARLSGINPALMTKVLQTACPPDA